jgi:hypothetical protein
MDCCTTCGANFSDWKIKPDDCPTCEPEKYAHPGLFHPITPTHVAGGRFQSHFDPFLDTFLTGPRHKQRVLKEKGLIEVGGEYEKHIKGKDLKPKPKEICTVDEVAKKMAEIKQKMHDPEYRHKYEQMSRPD